MGEVIWKSDDPNAMGEIMTLNCHGAIVHVMVNEKTRRLAPGEVPPWVRVAQKLAIDRVTEYQAATGHLPSRELVDTFMDVMEKRLLAFIEDPMKHPYKPMNLIQFEQTELGP